MGEIGLPREKTPYAKPKKAFLRKHAASLNVVWGNPIYEDRTPSGTRIIWTDSEF